MPQRHLKIAIVHDYLPSFGGAEQVLAVLHEIYPDAPIYTIFSDVHKKGTDPLSIKFHDAKIITSWFNYLPFRKRLMSPLYFLLPLLWAYFEFSNYDLVISSASWAITKGFASGKTKEICYCHTPPRNLYGYETSRNIKKHWYMRAYNTLVGHFLRMYDYKRAQNVTRFVANGREVQKRIEKFYRRGSVIVYPPVDVEKYYIKKVLYLFSKSYYLAGGRLEGPKNFDLIIKAANELKFPLKIYGRGPQLEYLKSISGPTVEFLGSVSEEDKVQLFQNCQAFIAAAVDEDFGITPVEAMAAGKPVVAYFGGGYKETVIEGKTGVFFHEQSVKSLLEAIEKINRLNIKPADCQKQAKKFSKERFVKKFTGIING